MPRKDQTIYIQEKEVKTVKTFKYLGSMFDSNGGAEKDVNNIGNISHGQSGGKLLQTGTLQSVETDW